MIQLSLPQDHSPDRLRTAMISSHRTFSEFAFRNPHRHTIVLEGGFDQFDTFFFISLGANEALTEIWRRVVIALFLDKGLLNPNFTQTPFRWRYCGFSIESGTHIYDEDARRRDYTSRLRVYSCIAKRFG
jgi:hypothetical protein